MYGLINIEEIDNIKLGGLNQILNESSLVSITDSKGNIIFANSKFCEISGYSERYLVGKNHKILNSGAHDPSFWKDMYKITALDKKIWYSVVKNKASDGSFYWVKTWIQALFDDNEKLVAFVSVRQDVTNEILQGIEIGKQNEVLVLENKDLRKLSMEEKSLDNRGNIAKTLVYTIFVILALSVFNDYVHKDSKSFKDIAMIFSGGLMGAVMTILGINQFKDNNKNDNE